VRRAVRAALVLQNKLVKIDLVDGDFTVMVTAAREWLDDKVHAFSN